jgi:hypothetical protein
VRLAMTTSTMRRTLSSGGRGWATHLGVAIC